MGVILSSIFRDSTGYIDRWCEQVADLEAQLDVPLQVIVAEGDSTDGTYQALGTALKDWGLHGMILREDHGGPKFGSVNDPQRWRQIAQVCNAVLDRVKQSILPTDRWLYIESDLVTAVDTPLTLLADLEDYPAVASMSMHGKTGYFYDCWGHRKDSTMFTPLPPYHAGLDDRVVEIDSAGSCFAVRGDLVPVLEFSPVDCVRGIGRTLRGAGSKLYLDTSVEVIHP